MPPSSAFDTLEERLISCRNLISVVGPGHGVLNCKHKVEPRSIFFNSTSSFSLRQKANLTNSFFLSPNINIHTYTHTEKNKSQNFGEPFLLALSFRNMSKSTPSFPNSRREWRCTDGRKHVH